MTSFFSVRIRTQVARVVGGSGMEFYVAAARDLPTSYNGPICIRLFLGGSKQASVLCVSVCVSVCAACLGLLRTVLTANVPH